MITFLNLLISHIEFLKSLVNSVDDMPDKTYPCSMNLCDLMFDSEWKVDISP